MDKGFYTGIGQMSGADIVKLAYGDKMRATIAPGQGNNLFSLMCGGTEVLHYDDTKPLADFLTGTPVLFPFPNRIEDAMYTWNGKTYLQKKDGVPIYLHSLVYDDKSWEYEEPRVTNDGALLRTWIEVDENHPIYRGFPFCFTLRIDYLVCEEGLTISYEVENQSDEDFPCGFALHPYFKRIGQTNITVPSDKVYEVRDDADPAFLMKVNGGYDMIGNILPTGELRDTKDTDYDLNTPRDVDTLALDDVFTDLSGSATIDYPSEHLRVIIESTDEFSHAVVYTPQEQPFFCIEPQTCSTDAVNLYARGVKHTGLMVLGAGETRGGSVKIFAERY